ncbi:MAG: chromosome segregation protein SMC, partial [Oscillospiraceae bacterium]|nr:chromosome segregation protein SMC [Oscillospiraceae bacterium]
RALRLASEDSHYGALIAAVEDVITSDTRETESIARRMKEAEQTATAKQAQAALLEEQIAEAERELADMELDRSEQAQQLRELTEQVNAKKIAQAALEAERESAQAAVAQLQTLFAQMQGDGQRKEELIAGYEAENAQTNEKIAALDAEYLTLKQRAERERDELAKLSHKRMTAEAEKTMSERSAQEKNKDILAMERESARLEQKKLSAEMEEKQIIDKLWESYGLTRSTAIAERAQIESQAQGQRRIGELKRKIAALGTPNLGAIEEFARVNERYEYLTAQRDDVLAAKQDLEDIVRTITKEMTAIFTGEFAKINEYFGKTFTEMFGGGKASLELEDAERPLDCGIEIRVQPPGKQLKTITLLSGGEKAFVAIALYFAILKVRPTPFCMLDEIDAALDDRNVERFASYLRGLSKSTQFIVVTHRRGTMEEADMLYGVTMQEQGVSKMLHLDMKQMAMQLGITN